MKGGQKPRHFVDISASPTSHLISPSLLSTSHPVLPTAEARYCYSTLNQNMLSCHDI